MASRIPRIHPTAIVDASAKIGDGVEIGPYCIVGDGVELGPDCWLQHHVTVCGPAKIGAGNRFFSYASIGQQTQDLKYAGEPTFLEIGENNVFREFVTVNRSNTSEAVTRIGSSGHFLAYSHIAHDCQVGNGVIFSNNGTLAGHVIMEDHAILGGLTAVHQFCRIGQHAITGGCAKITQDIPPFMIADGNPGVVRGLNLVGLQRHGFSEKQIRDLKEAYKILYRRTLNLSEAIGALREERGNSGPVQQLIKFIEGSDRGIIR